MTSFRLRMMAQVLPFLLITPGLALAQAPPSRSQAAAALNQPNNPAASYSRQQIDQMVAPIALYPDQLLTQVLMAATYPPQIVEAAQWLEQPGNAELKGDALVAALQPLPWDPSVKALVALPQVVLMLSEHIEWTQTLGVAFASQQAEVMTRVQALRHLAVKSGSLKQLRHLTVRQEGPAVVIVQAEPDRIYVPVYNPMVMYGPWPDRAYPPVFLPPPPRLVFETIAPGIQMGVGYGIVAPLWGWSRPNWRNQQITINQTQYTRITTNVNVNVRLGPGDAWRRQGPVVLAAPAARPRAPAATAAAPAGTVAPSAAAAVVNLPQRAARQPKLIQTQQTAQPAATQPGEAKTATDKPGTAQPGQAQTTPDKPGPARPGQAQTTPDKPGPARPGQAQTTPDKPGPARPGQAQTTPDKPGTAQPGQAQTTTTEPDATKPGQKTQQGQKKAATDKPGTAQPGQAQTTATEPDVTKPGQKTQQGQKKAATPSTGTTTESGKVQGTANAPLPSVDQPRDRAPAAGMKPPTGAREQMPRAPEQAGTRPPGGPQAAPPRVPEQAGAPPSARQAPGQAPGQAGAKPPAGPPQGMAPQGIAPPAGQAGQRPAPEGVRQGSSAPPPAGQSTQRPKHEPAGARAPGRPGPEDDDKKER